jgi:hypothetical protein
VQVVYSVANEGARLEIPEGPLGSLIQGTSDSITKFNTLLHALVVLLAECIFSYRLLC